MKWQSTKNNDSVAPLSADTPSGSTSDAHSRLASRSVRNLSGSKLHHTRVLKLMNFSGGCGSGNWNSTSEWSGESSPQGRTSATGCGRSDRVTTTSSMCPSRWVDAVTDCCSPNVSISSWNRRRRRRYVDWGRQLRQLGSCRLPAVPKQQTARRRTLWRQIHLRDVRTQEALLYGPVSCSWVSCRTVVIRQN